MKLEFHADPDQWTRYATALAKAQTGSPEELEDAVQAGILRMMPALRRLQPDAPAIQKRSYLRQFIVRGIQEHFQKFRSRAAEPEERAFEVGDDEAAVIALEDTDQRRTVLRAMQHLPNADRVVLSRIWWRRHSRIRVAGDLGLGLNHVMVMHREAIVRLRAALKGNLAATKRRRRRPEMAIETRGRKRLMARRRFVRPEFFADERFNGLTSDHRVLYLGLCTLADSAGIFDWRPIKIRAAVFPLGPELPVSQLLAELEERKIVVSYEFAGSVYGVIPGFRVEQPAQGKECPSTRPGPPAAPKSKGGTP